MQGTGSWSTIDRYVEFRNWPTSRKTALLMAVAFAVHVPLTAIVLLLFRNSEVYEPGSADRALYFAIAACASLSLVGWLVDRSGREGRWTAYAVALSYGAFLIWLVWVFGVWTTPLLGWIPPVIILVTLWYDHRVGLFALALMIVAIPALLLLVLQGDGSFAPAFAARDIDAQRSAPWALAMLLIFLGSSLYAFLLSVLTVIARNRQDERLAMAHQMIRRYAPAQVADEILSGAYVDGAPAERRKLTIFFSDIVGFTTTSDQLDPEDLSALLDDYLDEMAQVAERHDTSINQFLGDGILVFFGAPQEMPIEEGGLKAVRMALEMQDRIAQMGERWRRRGVPIPLSARIGIHTGFASVGDFGSQGRKVYTAIGMQVNVTARIQAQCDPGKILLSDATHGLIADRVETIDKGALNVKGVHYPVPVHEVVRLVPDFTHAFTAAVSLCEPRHDGRWSDVREDRPGTWGEMRRAVVSSRESPGWSVAR